jgi:hypothetical protein
MKRQWSICRQVKEEPDGQQRWDRAYRLLLQWAKSLEAEQAPRVLPAFYQMQEVHDESSGVCARLDSTPGSSADD